jgi:hypothetical protein
MRNHWRKIRLPLLLILLVTLAVMTIQHRARIKAAANALADASQRHSAPPPTDRRLIEWGWRTPKLHRMPEHIDAYQSLPFDGLILDAKSKRDDRGMGWTLYNSEALPQAEFDEVRSSVSGLEWGRLTDNFLRFNLSSENVIDWHADFTPTLANAEAWASVAHDLDFAGIMLDTEQYSQISIFAYEEQPDRDQYTRADYEQLAFTRGQEFMQALNRGYPGLTVMFTFGLSSRQFFPPEYWLMNPFIEGMIDAADDGTVLVDGFEGAYYFKNEPDFILGRGLIADYTPDTFSRDPDRYREKVRVGFGLWLDYNCGEAGLLPDGCPGGHTPNSFARAIDLASLYSDEYVWLYSERVNWLTGEGIPPEWADVLEDLSP